MIIACRVPLVLALSFFSLGIIANEMIILPFGILGLLVFFLLAASFLALNRPIFSTILLLAAIFCLGGLHANSRVSIYKNDISLVAKFYRGKTVFLKGIVASDIRRRSSLKGEKTSFALKVEEIKTKWGWRKKNGKVLVNVFKENTVSLGDRLLIQGKLHKPYNFSSDSRFSYKKYLLRKGIRHILSVSKKSEVVILDKGIAQPLKRSLFEQREALKKLFSGHFSENEAGILQAILLGDRSGVPEHIRKLFEHTGTAHVLAISGLHVGIVAALFFFLFRMLPVRRELHYFVPIILILYYVLLTGARPPVVRAGIMAAVFLVGHVLEREPNSVNSLSLAALIILVVDPMSLFDVGFQLSFAAVFSIILLFTFILELLRKLPVSMDSKMLDYIFQSFALSFSAWIGVSGLIAYYFQSVTPITIIANLFVIPFITSIVALGMGFLCLGSLFPFWACTFANCLKLMLNAMVGAIFLFDKVPGAYYDLKNLPLSLILCYYFFVLITALFIKKRGKLQSLP